MGKVIGIIIAVAIVGFLAYFITREPFSQQIGNMTIGKMELKSSAFKEGDPIPSKFTCDGENVSPLLEIKNIPAATKSLVLILDDPDATAGNIFTHWVLWNIDPKTQYISEDSISLSARQGMNSAGTVKYVGPCPPRGNPAHRYMFKLYSLDAMLDLPEGAKKIDVEQAMSGHILDQTILIGRYSRT